MTRTNEHHSLETDQAKDRFASDIETLKDSFTELRSDVTRILENTLGTGRSGAGLLRDRASSAVGDIKDRVTDLRHRGVESVEQFEQQLGARPLLSAAIAVGVGFVLATLITTRR